MSEPVVRREKVTTVDLERPSLYAEHDSRLHRFKRRLTYRNLLKQMDPVLRGNPTANILEIGSGSGYLLLALEELAPGVALTGIEYDPRLVDLARSKVKVAKVLPGNAESFHLQQSFDLVVSSQVIEHLYRPEQMIDRVWSHLKPGGWLIITTPNLKSVAARMLGAKWHGFRDDHVSLKSAEEWGAFISARGFRPIYEGSTFFSGIPWLNRFPLGVLNWTLLLLFGSLRWKYGESYVGVFEKVGKE